MTASCPVPIVIAGAKLPEHEALEMCWRAIDRRVRRGHGAQHLPVQRAARHAEGGEESGSREHERPGGVPVLAGRETGRSKMNVTLVEINIKPERVDEFLEVFRANHEGRSRSRATCASTYCRTRG